MALFAPKKDRTSFALFDCNSTSVGGALVHVESGNLPIIYYTVREPVDMRDHETTGEAMLRTLSVVADALIAKGGPTLRSETGSGHVDRVLVSIGTPWQQTSIRIEAISEQRQFIFTQALLSDILKKDNSVPEEFIKSKESVIATLLNGYEISKPFGKKVNRAEVVILSSYIEKNIAEGIEKVVRKTYHTHALTLTAFASVAYTALHELYPHEKDFLVLEVSGESTDIAFVKRGFLVDVATIAHGINDLLRNATTVNRNTGVEMASEVAHEESPTSIIVPKRNELFSSHIEEIEKEWLQNIVQTLKEASDKHALPHTLFLLADAEVRDYLSRLLDSNSMRSLWFSQDPLRILPVLPSHFGQILKVRGEADGDVYLELLSLYSKTL
jgi:hypothetical protein